MGFEFFPNIIDVSLNIILSVCEVFFKCFFKSHHMKIVFSILFKEH